MASVGLSLLICEGALRLTGRFQPPTYPPECSRPDLYQEFGPYGYRLWPSRTATYLYPKSNPRSLTVVSNKVGFRSNRELDEPDKRMRVLVVGDSFVFGDGVEESERFTNVLESMQSTWRVDNLGMAGYGPDLMLRALEEVGHKSHPAIVVWSMYTDDFRRVHPQYAGVGFKIPRFALMSGQIVTIPYPKPSPLDQLSLVVGIRQNYWKYSDAMLDLNAAILDRFLKLAKLRSFVPAIIFLPGKKDTTGDKARRAWLQQYAERNATPFLDLTDPIHKAGPQAFITNDTHLNAYGHWIVATELRNFINGRVLSHH